MNNEQKEQELELYALYNSDVITYDEYLVRLSQILN